METKLAKVTKARIVIEGHGILTAEITLDYGGNGQGIPGYNLLGPNGGKMIEAYMNAFGVTDFSDIAGRHIMAVIEDGFVVGFEPLPMDRGKRMIFSEVAGA